MRADRGAEQILGPSGFLVLDISQPRHLTRETGGLSIVGVGVGQLPNSHPGATNKKPRQQETGLEGWRVGPEALMASSFVRTLKRDHQSELGPVAIPGMADGSPHLF